MNAPAGSDSKKTSANQLATKKQLDFIHALWGKPITELTIKQASQYIDHLLDNQPKTICCSREFSRDDECCPMCGKKSGIYYPPTIPCPKTIYTDNRKWWQKVFR
jgi:hypothetical protein